MDRAGRILQLVVTHTGTKLERIDPDDIFGSTRSEGDDATELMDAFAQEFDVDLAGFIGVLHFNCDEPPPKRRMKWGVGANGKRIPDIPIRLADLVAAAETGRWQMDYPEHRLLQRTRLIPVLAFIGIVGAVILAIALLQHGLLW